MKIERTNPMTDQIAPEALIKVAEKKARDYHYAVAFLSESGIARALESYLRTVDKLGYDPIS